MESASHYRNQCACCCVSKILKHMPHWKLWIAKSLSQMVWHCQARLLFLFHSLISPVLWDLVCFCSPFQQHEMSLCYFIILLLHQCSYICNQVLYGDDQTLKNYKPQSAYIFGRVSLMLGALQAAWIWKKWGKDVLVCARCCCAITWMHVYHTKFYIMAYCLPGVPCKCTFNW